MEFFFFASEICLVSVEEDWELDWGLIWNFVANSFRADAISCSILASDGDCTAFTVASAPFLCLFPSTVCEIYWWCFTKFKASSIVDGCSKQTCFASSLSQHPWQNFAIASCFKWYLGKSTKADVANVITRSAQSSNDSSGFWHAWRNFALDVSFNSCTPNLDSNFSKILLNEYFSILVADTVTKSRAFPSRLHKR